jgi:GntR family transcriptional regulator
MPPKAIPMNAIPLYSRVVQDLVKRVQLGEFPADSQIPTEHELCRRYGVSRITVRKALDQLVARRILYRRRGVGTFVSPLPPSGKSIRFFGNLQDVLPSDLRHSYRVLDRGMERPPSSVARQFGDEEKRYHIRTVNEHDGTPYSVSDFYFASEYTETAAKMDLRAGKQPIQYLEEMVGVRVHRAEQTVGADIARVHAARALSIKPDAPVLRVQRTYYGADGTPLEVVVVRYHPERYQIHIDLIVPGREP